MKENSLKKLSKNPQFIKFCTYGFLKNLKFFEPFLMIYFLYIGLSYVQIGIIYMIKSIATNVMEIPSGISADILGRKLSMIISFLAYIVSFIFFYIFSNFYLIIIAISFFSIGEAFRSGTHKAMIFQYLKNNNMTDYKTKVYGITRSWSQIGSALMALLAPILVIYFKNYKAIFLASIIPYIFNIIMFTTYEKCVDNCNKEEKKNNKKIVLSSFFNHIKNPQSLIIFANAAIFTAFYKGIKDYIQPIIKNTISQTNMCELIKFDLTPTDKQAIFIGIIYFVIHILGSFSSKKAGYIFKKSDFKTMNNTLLLGFIVTVLTGLAFMFNLYYLSIFMFIMIFVIQNLRKPVSVSFVGDNLNQEIYASGLSAQAQIETFFTAIIALLLGVFTQKFGIGISIMINASFILIIYLISSFFFIKKDNSQD